MHAGLPLLQERTYHPFIISYSTQYLRVELGKLKMDSKKIIDVLLGFHASKLCLYNVTRQSLDNNYFECAKLQGQKKIISNGISLRIKSTPPKKKELDVTKNLLAKLCFDKQAMKKMKMFESKWAGSKPLRARRRQTPPISSGSKCAIFFFRQ